MEVEKNTVEELNELVEQDLIKDFNIIKSDINTFIFTVVTIEGINIELESSINYCYKVLNESDNFLYESFEQLLRKYSPAYSNKFGDIITDKLNALINKEEKNNETYCDRD
jgi:hypothetical protein